MEDFLPSIQCVFSLIVKIKRKDNIKIYSLQVVSEIRNTSPILNLFRWVPSNDITSFPSLSSPFSASIALIWNWGVFKSEHLANWKGNFPTCLHYYTMFVKVPSEHSAMSDSLKLFPHPFLSKMTMQLMLSCRFKSIRLAYVPPSLIVVRNPWNLSTIFIDEICRKL